MVALAPNGFLCSAKNHHWNPSFAVRADFGVDPIISSLCLIIISRDSSSSKARGSRTEPVAKKLDEQPIKF